MAYPISVNVQKMVNYVSEAIIESGIAGTIGYLCARAFRAINPLQALVLSALSIAVTKLTKPLFDKVFNNAQSNEASKLLGPVFNLSAVSLIYGASVNLAAYAFSITPIALSTLVTLNAISLAAYTLVNVGEAVLPTLLAEIK